LTSLAVFPPVVLETVPPVTIIIGKSHAGYYWRYNYKGCEPMGNFFNYSQALQDALTYSTKHYAD